jgi:AAA domain
VYYQSTLSPRVAQAENEKSPKPSAFTDCASITLHQLEPLLVWLAWQNDLLPGRKRPAKVPYAASMCPAATDDPATWGTKEQAIQLYKQLPLPCDVGGLGLVLTDIGGGYCICGIDLDTCRAEDGSIAVWATEVIEPFASYTEISPSRTGVKIFFILKTGDLAGLRSEIGNQHKKTWSRGGGEHPPAIELHLSHGYFAVTEQHVEGTPQILRLVEVDTLLWLIREAGPAFAGNGEGDLSRHQKIHDQSRSAIAFRIGIDFHRAGKSYEQFVDALRADPRTCDWVVEKGISDGERELRRIWEKVSRPRVIDTETDTAPMEPDGTELDLGTWSIGEDDNNIEPRQWLLGNLLCRRALTALYGDGGVGKSALLVGIALSLATREPFLDQHVFERCRVSLLSFEDDKDELRRRVRAGMRHYGISREQLGGNLRCGAITRSDLRLAQTENSEHKPGKLVTALEAEIIRHGIDVVILDPFVKIHGLAENDNIAIDFVASLLTGIAIRRNVAVVIAHHTRKGIADPGNADSGRGASSLKDAARLVYTLTRMSQAEAQKFGVSEIERRFLIRLDPGKANLAPAIEASWFKLIGVPLDNFTAQYPNGDTVQTVACWTPANPRAEIDPETEVEIIRRIDNGMENGQRYSPANAAKARAAWSVVKEMAPKLSVKQCRKVIDSWIKDGKLVDRNYQDPVTRHQVKGLFRS